MRRLFDIFFSLIALIIFLIPLIVFALIIKIYDKQNIFFKQERIGKNKIPFQIIKLQTLNNDKPTRIGEVLRKTGLDEIPQFINVLKGEMSIVGPRAITNDDIRRLNWDREYYQNRWSINPGITGYAQVYGGQNKKSSWFWDSYYLSKNNLFIDFGIILISFLMNIFGKTKIRRLIFNKKSLK